MIRHFPDACHAVSGPTKPNTVRLLYVGRNGSMYRTHSLIRMICCISCIRNNISPGLEDKEMTQSSAPGLAEFLEDLPNGIVEREAYLVH